MVLAPGDGTPLPVDGRARPDEPTDDAVELYDPPHDRRAFSPADTSASSWVSAWSSIGILVSVVAQETVKGVEEDLVEAFNRLPDGQLFVLSLAQLVTAFVPAVAIVVLVLRRRWRVALLLVLAGGLANVLMVVADALVIDRRLVDALDQIRDQRDLLGGAAYPSSAVLAATTAVVTVAAPWVSRRWRRALWWGVAILALLRLLAVAAPAFDLILGSASARSSARSCCWSSARRAGSRGRGPPRRLADHRAAPEAHRACPARGRHRAALRRHRRGRRSLRRHAAHARGQRRRPAQPYGPRPPVPAVRGRRRHSTLQRRLEHEALLLTLSERAGVRVPAVDRLGTTSNGAVFLVTWAPSTRPVTSDDLRSIAVQADAWMQVRLLHAAGIAHRHLDLAALDLDEDGRVLAGGLRHRPDRAVEP